MNIKNQTIHIAAGTLILFLALAAGFYLVKHKQAGEENFSLEKNPFGMRLIADGESPEDYLRSQMSICYKNGSDTCYSSVTSLLTSQFEYRDLLRTLENTQNYPEVFSRCHEVTHFIGRKSYQENPDIRKLYEQGSPACWGGFYHGVIEAYFDAKPYLGEEKFASEIRGVCGTQSDYSTPRFFAECLHGIGHAMMFVSDDNLPKSLSWCDKLPAQDQNVCWGGVFMENSSSSTRTGSKHLSQYIKTEDSLYPCNILEDRYLGTCYQYQSSYFASLVGYDWVKTANLCLRVPTVYQGGCFMIIGSNQVGNTQDSQKMKGVCDSMPTNESKEFCVKGVVSGLMGRYINEPEKTEMFCALLLGKNQKTCFEDMGMSLLSWSTDFSAVVHFCEMDNKKYREWCEQGLGNIRPQPEILN